MHSAHYGLIYLKHDAANAMAGAVFRPTGSSKMPLCWMLADQACSAAIKRCSSLQMIKGQRTLITF